MTDFETRLSRLTNSQLSELASQLSQRENARTQLVAFVVQNAPLPEEDLREHCKKHLPDYMLPQRIEVLEQLPLTTTGKVDVKKLHASSTSSLVERKKPETPRELKSDSTSSRGDDLYGSLVSQLTQVWCEVLQMDRILPDDDYFELGGDSIANLQIIARCAKIDMHFGPADLLQNPTIAQLARWLEGTTLTTQTANHSPDDASSPADRDLSKGADSSERKQSNPDESAKSEVLRVLNLGRDN